MEPNFADWTLEQAIDLLARARRASMQLRDAVERLEADRPPPELEAERQDLIRRGRRLLELAPLGEMAAAEAVLEAYAVGRVGALPPLAAGASAILLSVAATLAGAWLVLRESRLIFEDVAAYNGKRVRGEAVGWGWAVGGILLGAAVVAWAGRRR